MKEVQISLLNTESFDSVEKTRKSKVCFLPLADLGSNPLNWIYEDLDTEEELDELIGSIKETGLQQPLIASRSETGGYVLSFLDEIPLHRVGLICRLFNHSCICFLWLKNFVSFVSIQLCYRTDVLYST